MSTDLKWEISEVRVDEIQTGTLSYRARAMIPMMRPNLKVILIKISVNISIFDEYIDVGDGCWIPNVLMTRFGCW